MVNKLEKLIFRARKNFLKRMYEAARGYPVPVRTFVARRIFRLNQGRDENIIDILKEIVNVNIKCTKNANIFCTTF